MGWDKDAWNTEAARELESWEYDLVRMRYTDLLLDFPKAKLTDDTRQTIIRVKEINPQEVKEYIPDGTLTLYCEILFPVSRNMVQVVGLSADEGKEIIDNMVGSMKLLITVNPSDGTPTGSFKFIPSKSEYILNPNGDEEGIWITSNMIEPFYFYGGEIPEEVSSMFRDPGENDNSNSYLYQSSIECQSIGKTRTHATRTKIWPRTRESNLGFKRNPDTLYSITHNSKPSIGNIIKLVGEQELRRHHIPELPIPYGYVLQNGHINKDRWYGKNPLRSIWTQHGKARK